MIKNASTTLKCFRTLCIILGKPVEKFQGQFSAKSMIVILPEWCLDHHQHEPELEKTWQVYRLIQNSKKKNPLSIGQKNG